MNDNNKFLIIMWLIILILNIIILKSSITLKLDKINNNLEDLKSKIEVKLDV